MAKLVNMPLMLPSLEEQICIGEMFSALDKKININRAINSNLVESSNDIKER